MGANSAVGCIMRQKLLFEKLVPKTMFKNYTGSRVKECSIHWEQGKRGEGLGGQTVVGFQCQVKDFGLAINFFFIPNAI